jgi:thiamine-phosphate pyrophosphorylase
MNMQKNLTGLYVITDKELIQRDSFVQTVEKSIRGGARLVQLREKDTPEDETINLGLQILEVTRRYGVPLIINDSPEIAREIGADGVHIGGEDASVHNARAILGADAIIGVSCYNRIERGLNAVQAGADYVAFGTPYNTPTKPDREPTSIEILNQAVKLINEIPVFAIGGITKENARTILETGVDGIAVITSVFGSTDPEKAARELTDLIV